MPTSGRVSIRARTIADDWRTIRAKEAEQMRSREAKFTWSRMARDGSFSVTWWRKTPAFHCGSQRRRERGPWRRNRIRILARQCQRGIPGPTPWMTPSLGRSVTDAAWHRKRSTFTMPVSNPVVAIFPRWLPDGRGTGSASPPRTAFPGGLAIRLLARRSLGPAWDGTPRWMTVSAIER